MKFGRKTILIGIGGLIGILLLCLIVGSIYNATPEGQAALTEGAETKSAQQAQATNQPAQALANTAIPTQAAAPTAKPTSTSAPEPSATSLACMPASQAQLDRIRAGVKGVAESNDIKEAFTVKSGAHQNAWFVAAKIYGPGMEDGTGPGLWIISGDPDNPGITLSVNAFAKEFSFWPDASKTDAQATQFDEGAPEALECAK